MMEIQRIKIDKIFPNNWNPNHLSGRLYKKLKLYIQKEAGAVIPLVLRPHLSKRGCYEIIDGYHRWNIYQELGHKEVDAIVTEVSDDQAKILTVNLNYMRGQAKPMEYARLIHDLTEKYTLDDLELMLPDDKPQLLDRLDLLQLPGDLKDTLEDDSEKKEKEALVPLNFQVTAKQKEEIEAAIGQVDTKKKGTALAKLVKAGSDNIGSLKS